MPLWLYAYSSVLRLPLENTTGPYLYLALALAVMATPVLVGILCRRCAAEDLPRMDRVLLPACMLPIIIDVCVKVSSFPEIWQLLTGKAIFAASLLPLCGALLGGIGATILRQPLPKIKSVALTTAIQNTVLARIVIQSSYEEAEAIAMSVTLACVDAVTLMTVLVSYIFHLVLWVKWPYYRPLHKSDGLGGLDHTFVFESIHLFIQTKGKRWSKQPFRSPKKDILEKTLNHPSNKHSLSVNTLGSLTGRMITQNPRLSKPKMATAGPSNIFLHYLASPEPSPASSIQRSDRDSMAGIDYAMLRGQKPGRDQNAVERKSPSSSDDYQKMTTMDSCGVTKSMWSARTPTPNMAEQKKSSQVLNNKLMNMEKNLWIDPGLDDMKSINPLEHIYDRPINSDDEVFNNHPAQITADGLDSRPNKRFGENTYIVGNGDELVLAKIDSKDATDIETRISGITKTTKPDWTFAIVSPGSPGSEPDSGVSDIKDGSTRDTVHMTPEPADITKSTMEEWVTFSTTGTGSTFGETCDTPDIAPLAAMAREHSDSSLSHHDATSPNYLSEDSESHYFSMNKS